MLYLPVTHCIISFVLSKFATLVLRGTNPKTISRRSEPYQRSQRVIKSCEAYPYLDLCPGKQQSHLFSPAISDSVRSLYLSIAPIFSATLPTP